MTFINFAVHDGDGATVFLSRPGYVHIRLAANLLKSPDFVQLKKMAAHHSIYARSCC